MANGFNPFGNMSPWLAPPPMSPWVVPDMMTPPSGPDFGNPLEGALPPPPTAGVVPPQNFETVPTPAVVPEFGQPDVFPTPPPTVSPGPAPGVTGIPGVSFAGPENTRPLPTTGSNIDTYRNVIGSMEADNRGYQTVVPSIGRGGRRQEALGRYGVMDFNLPTWSREAFGREISREEFLNNPALQDQLFNHRFGLLLQEHGGDPGLAAQVWLAGSLTNPRADRFGTTGASYRNQFLAALAAAGRTGNGISGVANLSPEFAEATGSPETRIFGGQFGGQFTGATPPPTPPPRFSPNATALAPGLEARNPPNALGAFFNSFMGPPPAVTGQGGILDYLNLDRGARAPRDYAAQQGEAAMAIFRRGQELRVENPGATAEQLTRMLIRDPVFGRNALMLGNNGPAVLQAAINPPTGPATFQAVAPGAGLARVEGGQVTGTGISQPPPEAQLLDWLMRLPPDQQAVALQMIGARRAAQPSDREQAWERLRLQNPSFYTPEMRDMFLAGLIRPVNTHDQYGVVNGQQWVNALTNQPLTTQPGAGVGTPPPAGGPGVASPFGGGVLGGGVPGVTPPASGTPPPITPTDVPGITIEGGQYQPGQLVTQDMINRLGTQIPGMADLFPGMGTGGIQTPTPPTTRRLNTDIRVIGRMGDRDVRDVPDLRLDTSLISNPAHMFLAAGPEGVFRGIWGRIVGNIPGLDTSGEADINRQILLQNFASAWATYRRGVRLAGEHQVTMAEVPSTNDILTNPLRAIQQGIAIREGLVRDLELATGQISNQTLDSGTRREASNRVAEIQGLLGRLPDLQSMFALRDQLREGERIERGGLTGIGEAITGARTAVGAGQTTVLPPDLSNLELPDLQRLSRREGLTAQDAARLEAAIRRKLGLAPGSK